MNGKGITHIGKVRSKNEDAFFISDMPIYGIPNLYIVADGMGGHNAGEIASKTSIEFFLEYIKNNHKNNSNVLDLIVKGVSYSNDKVYLESLKNINYIGMGTTFTCCVVRKDKLLVAHVGDSRVYVIKEDEIIQITNDHTYVNEMFKNGNISEKDLKTHPKRNMLTRALGTELNVNVDSLVINIEIGNKILICSDGLTNMTENHKIFEIVKNNANIDDTLNILINVANDSGGIDNITIVLTEIVEVES